MSHTQKFKDAMSRYPTGVTVVATYFGGKAVGITANSFASVSLEPPLVLWSIDKAAERYEAFRKAKSYSICFLGKNQADIAQHCADIGGLPDGQWTEDAAGFPVISGANVILHCRQSAVHEAGDHDIIVGEVLSIEGDETVGALSFYKRDYGQLD